MRATKKRRRVKKPTLAILVPNAYFERLVDLTATGMYGSSIEETATQLLGKAIREEREFWR